MALIDRIFDGLRPGARGEIRTSQELDSFLRGESVRSLTGASVNNETAMRISAVNACTRILGEDVAGLPGKVFRRKKTGGRTLDRRHWLYPIVHDRANDYQSAFEFRETAMVNVVLLGNFYAFKIFNSLKELHSLIPIQPHQVEDVKLENGRITYWIADEEGGESRPYTQDRIFHLKGISTNGFTGRSVLSDARETFGYALALQEFGSRLFSNRANFGIAMHLPKGVLFGSKRHQEIKESLQDEHTQLKNAWRSLLLEEGMAVEKISMSLEDAQFVEMIKASIADIARIFKIPLHRLAELSKSSFNNIEQQSLEYVIYTLRPWLVRLEQAINMQLLKNDPNYFVEFSVEGLLRGDMASQAAALATEFQNGALLLNEWRELKNRNPYPSEIGETPFIQMNLASPESTQPVNGSAQAKVINFERLQAKYDLLKKLHQDEQISDFEFCEKVTSIRRSIGLPPLTFGQEEAA